jgi:hypothetical protein
MHETELLKDNTNPLEAFVLMQQERIEKLEVMVFEMQRGPYSSNWRILGVSHEDLTRLANANRGGMMARRYNVKKPSFCANVLHLHFWDWKNERFVRDMASDLGIVTYTSICAEHDSPCIFYQDSSFQHLSMLAGMAFKQPGEETI